MSRGHIESEEKEEEEKEERDRERKKRRNERQNSALAASSSVTVAARILLDIPRVVRMRSSECRARKPRRMAPRVWVVCGKGRGEGGKGRREQGVV